MSLLQLSGNFHGFLLKPAQAIAKSKLPLAFWIWALLIIDQPLAVNQLFSNGAKRIGRQAARCKALGNFFVVHGLTASWFVDHRLRLVIH